MSKTPTPSTSTPVPSESATAPDGSTIGGAAPPRPTQPDDAPATVHGRIVRPAIVLVTCCAALFISSMNVALINVALPVIRASLSASTTQLQWVIDAYTLMIAALLLVSGSMADRFGRKRALLVGLVLFAVTSALCALAPTVTWLVVGRGLQATGGALLTPVALSIISATYTDPARRAAAIGVWGAVAGLSLGLGPLVGGLLTDTIGWAANFWLNVPVCLIAAIGAVLFVPESRAARPRRFDPAGQILMLGLLAGAVGALIEGPEAGWSSSLVLTLAVLAVVCLALLTVVERRVAEPLVDLRFFRSAAFSSSVLIAVMVFTVQGGCLFLVPLLLQGPFGYSALMTGALILPMAAVLALSSPVSGRLVGRRGTRPSLVIGGAAISAASVMLVFISTGTPAWYLIIAFTMLGAGIGFINPPITTTAVAGLPLSQAGTASGLASASRQVGVALGVAVAGLAASTDDLRLTAASHPVFRLTAVLGLVVAALGVVSTTRWARGTRHRLDALFNASDA